MSAEPIEVTVRYTGPLRGLAGRDSETVSLPAGSTLRDLLRALAPRLPAAFGSKVLAPLESGNPPPAILLLNREHLRSPAGLDRPLATGDVAAFVPPMEGGAPLSPRERGWGEVDHPHASEKVGGSANRGDWYDVEVGWRGAGLVRRQHVGEGMRERARALRRAMTPAEALLWNALRSGQVRGLRFRRQQVIGGYIADFYCHQAGLVVEVDGESHRTEAGRASDAERDAILTARGLKVLHVTNEDVLQRLDPVLELVHRACQMGAAT